MGGSNILIIIVCVVLGLIAIGISIVSMFGRYYITKVVFDEDAVAKTDLQPWQKKCMKTHVVVGWIGLAANTLSAFSGK